MIKQKRKLISKRIKKLSPLEQKQLTRLQDLREIESLRSFLRRV